MGDLGVLLVNKEKLNRSDLATIDEVKSCISYTIDKPNLAPFNLNAVQSLSLFVILCFQC